MFTEKAFAEAQSKGYVIRNQIIGAKINEMRDVPDIEIDQDIYFTLHDPMFWQKLGEARGWRQEFKYPTWKKEEGTGLIIFYPDDSWASWMHRYVDHVIEHGFNDHQQFFKQFYPLPVEAENHDINS